MSRPDLAKIHLPVHILRTKSNEKKTIVTNLNPHFSQASALHKARLVHCACAERCMLLYMWPYPACVAVSAGTLPLACYRIKHVLTVTVMLYFN